MKGKKSSELKKCRKNDQLEENRNKKPFQTFWVSQKIAKNH